MLVLTMLLIGEWLTQTSGYWTTISQGHPGPLWQMHIVRIPLRDSQGKILKKGCIRYPSIMSRDRWNDKTLI